MIEWQDLHHSELSVSQLYALLQLRCAVFVVEQNCPYQDIDGDDLTGDNRHILGWKNDELVAYARILKSEDASVNDVGYISTLTLYRRFMKSPIYGQLKDGVVEDMTAEPSADEQQTARHLVEGAILQDEHCTGRERNREAREQCIAYYRTLHKGHVVCECCGFDFEKAYGEMGKDFIEVHHRYPISQTDGEHAIDPKNDLVPLCSNCHSMIHRLATKPGDCISLEELKRHYIGKKYL